MRRITLLALVYLSSSLSAIANPALPGAEGGALRVLSELAAMEERLLSEIQAERRQALSELRRGGQALSKAAQGLSDALDAASGASASGLAAGADADQARTTVVATARARLEEAKQAVADSLERSRDLARREQDQLDRAQGMLRAVQAAEKDSPERGPLEGRWQLRVDPVGDEGELLLRQFGTLVSGQYKMISGRTGSVRGTFVQEKLQLEVIDARFGRDATYYGVLGSDVSSLTGTWEAVRLGTGRPAFGHWKAARIEEDPAE